MPYKDKNIQKEFQKQWYIKNKERLTLIQKTEEYKKRKKIYNKKCYDKNKEKFNIRKKIWRQLNKEKIKFKRRILRKKYMLNINYKLKNNLRERVRKALFGKNKSKSTSKLLGANIMSIRSYIENKFKPGMTWENYGKWEIDHILPCAYFNLENPEEQLKCFHYTNLQPLWAEENRKKGSKINGF